MLNHYTEYMLSELQLSEIPDEGSGTKRDRQRADTRRQLVDSALRIVAEAGFAGASTAAIAKATGKAHGTVFIHFPTRDDLVNELVAQVGRTMSQALSAGENQTPLVAEVLSAHLEALRANEVLYARMLKEAATLPLAARTYIFALQSGISSRLKEAYTRENAAGTVRSVDPVFLGNVWIGLTNHYLINREFFAPGAFVIDVCGAQLMTQVLMLIAKE